MSSRTPFSLPKGSAMRRGPRGEKRPGDVIGAAVTPAMAAGITDKLCSVEDIVVEASEPKSGKRRPYKKRAAA